MTEMFAVPKKATSPLRPRLSLHDEVVARLRDMILDGELPPGEWIAEMKLCNDLSISRTPLREALKVLASENLITLLPNRGAVVTDIRVEEIVELFEIMDALEALVGRLAVERASDADIAALQAMHKTMVGYHDSGNRAAYFDLNQAIHQRIADLTGKRLAREHVRRLRGQDQARAISRQSLRCALGGVGARARRVHGGARETRRRANSRPCLPITPNIRAPSLCARLRERASAGAVKSKPPK